MKKNVLLFFFAFLAVSGANAATITISNSGLTFSPDVVTINQGDTVLFAISASHNAVEVSQATYDAGGSTALSGGFSVAFGGGVLTGLSAGEHFYVCQPHASAGMKGKITVQANSTAPGIDRERTILFPNPALNLVQLTNLADEEVPFRITDRAGREVLNGTVSSLRPSVSITNLKAGAYFLILQGREKNYLSFVKE